MPRKFTNPHAFANECKNVNVTLELLLESQLCVGKQHTARFFSGKCQRGGGGFVSSALIEDWIETLTYAKNHPEEKDNDVYQRPRDVLPTDEWTKFIELVYLPIEDVVVQSWEKMSKKTLGKEAKKYGITFGTANNKALDNLHQRMSDMVERRRLHFWNKDDETVEEIPENLKLLNINQLQNLAKELGVISSGVKKENLIDLILTKREQLRNESKDIFNQAYDEMKIRKLKMLCKDRGVNEYINKSRDELITILKELDRQTDEKEDKFILGGVEIQSRPSDCYINATQLCKAGKREFFKWNEIERSKKFVQVLGKKLELTREQLIESVTTGLNEDRMTWVHPRIAIQIAQWVSPEFALNVSEWVEKLLSTGSVSIGRPVHSFCSLTEIDAESIELEKTVCVDEFTRYSTIYVAYIGRGLVKVGFSDGNIVKRNDKHLSTESQYPQYRIIKLLRVSGRPMERDVHKELYPYQVNYNRQKEVFKPPTTLTQFIERIEKFLYHHDILLRYEELRNDHQQLQTQLEKFESKLLKIKVWALENKVELPEI
jgi:hypothetical protein